MGLNTILLDDLFNFFHFGSLNASQSTFIENIGNIWLLVFGFRFDLSMNEAVDLEQPAYLTFVHIHFTSNRLNVISIYIYGHLMCSFVSIQFMRKSLSIQVALEHLRKLSIHL